MKQIAQNYRSGELALLDVALPVGKPGGLLVRTTHSLVSVGTETMKIRESRLSLAGKARARPDQVKRVVQAVSQQGVVPTYRKVTTQLDSWTPLGYSLAGEVVEVGADCEGFFVGQRVACAGNAHALHAEYNWVPRQLCVAVPDEVSSLDAAFTTVGAIALQGLRQSEASLGEVSVVIGMGLVGQLLTQLLRAGGMRVFAVDPQPLRRELALQSGALGAFDAGSKGASALDDAVRAATGGAGADHVFLTAGGDTNSPVEVAALVARDRARVVDIGKCRLDLPWKDYYEKELDLRFSRSYGPGRYDDRYEIDGVDYPIGYVRWTERRNLACFLDLLAAGKVDVQLLVSDVVPFSNAVDTYEQILSGERDGVGYVFRFEGERRSDRASAVARSPGFVAAARDVVRVGVIGAGSHATSMLLPHMAGSSDVELVEVVTATSLSAANAQRRFGFQRMSTAADELIGADDVDALVIATRHDTHADLTAQAIEAGKAVFVEKPLAVDSKGLRRVTEAIERSGNDRVLVGFNRRYSPVFVQLYGLARDRAATGQVRYEVNAGPLPAESWYRASENGGRFAGEAGHFIDTISWWVGEDPASVSGASSAGDPDDLVVTLRYPGGAVGALCYSTGGDSRYPKEVFHAAGAGTIARMQNFRRIDAMSMGRRRVTRRVRGVDKGHRHLLAAFFAAVRTGGSMPIHYSSLVRTTEATLASVQSSRLGMPVTLGEVASEAPRAEEVASG